MLASEGTAPATLTGVALNEEINREGAAAVLRRLFATLETEEALLKGIGTGGADWLLVAERLRPASDGAASLGLTFAVQDALPKNPGGVLQLVQRHAFSVEDACGGYGSGQIEDERPAGVIRSLVQTRVEAVHALRSRELAVERKACLEHLAALKGSLAGK